VLDAEARELIQQFFKEKRKSGKGDTPLADPDSGQV